MFHTHWSDQFPYLVPIWHSLSNQNLLNAKQNSVDLNLVIDFGGVGMYNKTVLKDYNPLQFTTNRPSLPFYVKPKLQKNICQAGRNCLAFSSDQKVLFSANQGSIDAILVSIDDKRFQYNLNDVDYNFNHRFTDKKHSRKNPFCFITEELWHLSESSVDKPSEHILEIRLEERENQELKLWSHSRTSLKGYKYSTFVDVENNDLRMCDLSLEHDLSATSSALFPSENSLLNHWDRNDYVTEDFLTSFVENNNIYKWNIEANKFFIENKVNPTSPLINSNNLIGIQWAKALNPFLYFYGTHNDIFLGDTRSNMNGSQKMSQTVMNAQKFSHFKNPIELFQTFIANPVEHHQIITSSDFSINFLDIRYPGKNIFQCKHMLTSRLANKLFAKQIECNDSEMMLIASNSERSCLFSFNAHSSIQPIMQFSPYFIGMPKETGILFPALQTETSFITGTQILSGTQTAGRDCKDFISIAQLTTIVDIYMQDFWRLNSETPKQLILTSITSSDKKQNISNKKDMKDDFDEASKLYLKSVLKYLKKKTSCKVAAQHDQAKNHHSKKRLKLSNTENFEIFQHSESSLESQSDQDSASVYLLEESSDDEHISIGESKIADGLLNRDDKKMIDLELFQGNWNSFSSNKSSSIGLRDICHSLTVTLCDQWFDKLNTSPLNKTSQSSIPE